MDQFKKKRLPLLIAGAGGKKSSGSSRTPVEADDTVNSRAMASILDLLGEGVVGGLINGAKSIFIDGVALENEDGSFNYSGVTWDFRDGSQDQSPMPGFDFVETPKAVNTQLKTTNAVTVAIDNDDADRVRVIMKFPSLRSIDKKTGDTNGTSVQFKFQLANGNGSFYDVIATGEISSDVTLTAKKTGVYYRSYEIQLPKPGRAYKVRVLRLSADSNDQYLFNDTWVDSIGEIVDTPMNYPNSVLVGLKVNSEQFGSSMPSRSYLIRGLKIRVPSNYDENTNTYNGVWDGTFKLLSSSNPAWILFDLLTNARYGLGKFVSESMIDLGQLYQIGRYCDEEVDDGFGGKEKRFAINTQITSRQDAYRLIQDIAGAFRGMVFWAGGMVNIMQDSPSDPVMLFTNANVKDGLFTYKGSARKDRPSVALITYNNKQDGYKQNVEYVEDQEAMARYGERKTEAVAFGCTSRGQAHRVGLWLLYTARMESDMITFTAGLDASFLMPGETVLIQNKYRAGKRNSGRIVSFTKNSITLDAPVSLKKSSSFIRIINQEGKIVERDINETGDNITKVTFKTALATADQPVANGVWTITEPDLVPMRARVVAIAQGETPGSFDITVVQNNASKYQAIDNGATLVPENTTVLDPTYSKPSNLVISEGTYLSSPGNLSVKLMLAWEGKSPEYWVSWRRSDEGNVSNWQSARATEEQYEIVNVAENGRYDFQLYSVSFGGKKSEIITAVYQVKGTMTPPGAPTSLTAVGDYRNVVLNWVNPDSVDLAQINVYASKTNKLDTATLIAQAATTTFTHAGLGDNETWYYWIRAVNKRGMVGQPNSNLGTEATTRDVLSFLKDKITSSELGKELLDEIDSKATQEAVDNAIGEVQNSVNESIQQVENDLAQTSSEIKAQVDSVNQSLKENIDTVNQTIVDNIDTVNQTINTNISNVNSQIEAAKQSIKDGDAALSQEIKKAQSSLTTSLSQTSKDLTAAIQKETNDRIADVNDAAKQAADQLLSAKNELKTSIDSLSEVVTSGDENLARQISQIAAGTGEQFDSLKIWYFDQDAEGWTEDDNGYTPMSVTSDGWLKANNPTSTCRSPNGLTIDAHAYRFIKMRIKKVGNPTWNAKMFWIGADETGWNAGRSVVINEPEYDDKGIAILTLHDIEWRDSTTIRCFRFDFTSGQDADNYLLFDWIAVGRPTPGAGMAALQEEQQARANADTAEAQARSTLAAQIRGSSESGNLDDIRSGLIYQEKNARITADAAEASARESLQTEFNRNKASVAEELHTLSTEQASQASKITGLQTSLGQKADASAVQTISQKVEEQGNTLKSQGAALSTLDNRVGSVESGVSANSKAITGLQSTVTQQDKTLSSQSESITKLTNDLATTNNNVSKKADQSALSVLSGRVDQTESGLSSANSSITALNSSVRAGNATSGDLISNPTFDPEFSQMGFTVVSSSSEGVPANCPYAYVARIAARDHHPNFAAIPATLGDVYEMSALVACGAGSADFNLYLGTATRPSGSVGAPLSSGGNRKASATWQRVTWRFKITQGIVDRGFFRPFLQINQSSPFGTVWYVTDWHLRNVTDSSKVQDSLDATAKAVDSLTSTVNQQGENISSIGTRTTNLENNLRTTNANIAQKADANALTALTNRVTQTEKDINSTSSSVTNLKNKVDAISVGGTNLIKNSGDMTGWSNVVSDTYRGNAVIGATVKAGSGYKDLREITLESPVDAGEYVYSFYAKGGVAGQTMTAFFYNPNTTTSIETSQGAKGNNTDGRAQFTLTTSWARYWVKWKQTPTTGTKRLILCRIESNTSKDQTVYINSPKFEVGNVVSDWNESPSDSASASAVDSLTTKVNQQGTSISSIGNRTTSLENGLSTAQNNIAKKADASALQDLRNTVTSQGGDLTAANSSITSLQASMNRRTVFTVTARGNGNSVTHGVFDESGKNLFTPGRSWALVTFAKHSDGSTVIATSKTYDVFGSANNGATMSADIEALASGTYVCVLTFDEPSGNRGKILSALESLGGTSEVVNSLPYRGAYILLGRKGMKPGDGLELRAPTGGDGTAHISTSVEFVNGVMMGLGAAGGVMMKADANASAITTLQNTVKTQGDNIDSLSSSTTALENSLASSNASVDAASQIPGNLIVNPSFERGTEGYAGWSGIATVVTLQVPHLGTKAAKLAAGGSAGVGQKISFKKDRSYKIGIWAKQDPNTTIQSTDNTKFRVAEGNGLIASKAYGPFTSNWQEVSWTWKATKDVVADVQFTAFLSAGAMYFDDFYVVDVTDSVETQANSSAITKLDSRVTKTENDITSQGSQVTQLKNDLATTNTNVSKKADAAALTALTNRVTQNEKEIETQSSQTTSLKNSLSTVQAMGSNPWFDGSLETYSENQQISGSRAVVVSSQKRSGTKSLRVSRGAGEGGNSDKSIGKWIALRENAVFRIELWAMMPADQSPSSGWSTIVGLQTQNAANNNNWPSAITITEGSLGGRGTWKKFTGTLRVATGHTRGVFWISTRGSTGAGTPGYDLYIDDVVVTDITDAKEAQDSANANASALTSLTSRVTYVEGQVTSQASQLSSLTSQVNDASSKVDQMAQTITNNEKTQSSLNTSLQSQIDAQASANIKNQTELNNATTSLAAIKSTQQTQATTISALSQQQTNLTAQVGGQSAELQELKKTVVENGNVNSTWMVKMETNSNGKKYAAGIALGIDGKNLQSQFLVQADRFGLINTSNGNTTTPFVVENGVAYMNAAVIKDGSITNAKIGGEIRSDNFVNGSSGWRIGKDGSSQFNNVVIRGEVHANTGVLNNVTINENCTVLGTVQANKIVGDVVTMTDRVVKNWPASGNTSSGTRYLIATIDGMPFERRMVFNGSVAIVQVWRQNVTIRVDETTVWTFDSGNDGKDFETSIFSIRIPASNFGQRHQITIQWPNRGDSGQFRFTGVVSMYRTTGSISLA
ncbi:phage tail protein [Klebsiella pneumoniae]|nr:phage tail protein [Klebsiella pneumoniae]MCJ5480442.1 phage tail protein [Klebsiella pneumoniae]